MALLLLTKAHGFYGAREFAVHKSLKETLTGVSDQSGLAFPPHLLFSTDHTNPKWRLSSHRRLKNVLVSSGSLNPDPSPSPSPNLNPDPGPNQNPNPNLNPNLNPNPSPYPNPNTLTRCC